MNRLKQMKTAFAVMASLSCMQSVCAQSESAQPVSAQPDSIDIIDTTVVYSWEDGFRHRIDSIVQTAETDHYFTGMCVYDLTGDSVLYTHNANKLMRPASTQKVLTAVAALSTLGAGHKYETKAYYAGHLSAADSTLHGDIYVMGDFDPAYTSADLHTLAYHIKSLGIKHIEGRIIGDVSMKDTLTMGNGWCWDDVPSQVEPYLSPLTFNRGCATVEFDGGRPVFSVPTSYMNLVDSTHIKGGKLNVTRDWVDNGNTFTVFGAPKKGAVSRPISVYRPEKYFVCTLADMLRSEGVTFTNNDSAYAIGCLPDTTVMHFYTCARTVEQILQLMMKDSDNLYAESMFYQLANIDGKKWSSWKDGAARVEAMMERAGVKPDSYKIADGSGVSLYNYVTPAAEVDVLRYAYKNQNVYPHLYPALPIAGMDGTLEKRMTKGAAHLNVHAKTGTVSGVSCLAGYCRASNGNMLAFSIMNNGLIRSSIGRDLQDLICEEMVK